MPANSPYAGFDTEDETSQPSPPPGRDIRGDRADSSIDSEREGLLSGQGIKAKFSTNPPIQSYLVAINGAAALLLTILAFVWAVKSYNVALTANQLATLSNQQAALANQLALASLCQANDGVCFHFPAEQVLIWECFRAPSMLNRNHVVDFR